MNGLQSIEMPMFLFYLHVSTYFQQAMLGKTYVVPRQSFFSPPRVTCREAAHVG